MKEIDTESPVIWPAWCYSKNLEVSEYLNKSLSKTTKFKESAEEPERKDENHCVINKSALHNNKSIDDIVFQKLPLKRKILKAQSVDEYSQLQEQQEQQLQESTVAINQQIEENNNNNNNNNINIRKKRRKRSNIQVETKMLREHSLLNSLVNFNKLETPKTLEGSQVIQTTTTIDETNTTTTTSQQATAAATLLFLDQAKNEAAARLDSLKDAIMESAANALENKNNTNNNNNNSNNNNNNNSMNVRNNNNHLLLNQVRNQNQLLASNEIDNSTTDVKRERLSPGTNGELLTNYTRCRSATPSPQQALHISSPQPPIIPVHNLSTNLLNSLQATANCQSSSQSAAATQSVPNATNYSDFMRSLAAKYNNTNPNDSSTPRRHAFFDNKINSTQKPAISILPEREPSAVSTGTVNSLISPVDLASAAFKSTNVQNQMVAAAAAAGVSPFMTSLLSTLPFPQGILAPWIDMSNTQALLILSRAAKEAKLEKTMRSMQSPKRSHSSASSSPRPNNNLSTALHQAAQLISPTLLYTAQAQKTPNLRSQQNSPAETQHIDNETVESGSKMSTNLAVPLDLSSQPPVNKRFKAESTSSSRSSVEELTNIVTSGLKRTSIATAATTKIASPIASPKVSTAPTTRQHSLKTTAVSYRQQCQSQSEEVDAWTVDDVCTFVASIDICAEYVENFRNQQIDGSGLPLLTEDHLVNWLGMKLGPALKLRSILAKKLGGPCPCVACVAQSQQILALNQQQQQQQQQQQIKRISSRENSPTQKTIEQQTDSEAIIKHEDDEEVEEDVDGEKSTTTTRVQEQEEHCCNNNYKNDKNNMMYNHSKSGGNKGSNNGNNSCSEAIFLTCAKNNNNNNNNSNINNESSFECNSNINNINSSSSNSSKPNNNNNNNNNINNNNLPGSTCNSNIVNNLSSYCKDTFKNSQNTNSRNNNNNNDIDTKLLKQQNYL